MNGVRDHDALALHPAAVADLLDLRVDEQIRIATLKRPLTKRRDLFVEQAGDPADLGLRDPQPERLDELIDSFSSALLSQRPQPVVIAMRRAILGALATLRTDQLADRPPSAPARPP